uniref:Uncharacterized protein n=1 Tax=Anguilla anguilla TaxID=7936 RepID=A0A0E9TR79_ANGAN
MNSVDIIYLCNGVFSVIMNWNVHCGYSVKMCLHPTVPVHYSLLPKIFYCSLRWV